MIKLVELISHIFEDEKDKGLTVVDNWKITDGMYLEDMGFKNDGMYYYALKNPELKISHKKGEGFIVEDNTKKEKHAFSKFREVESYFENYKQNWDGAPYL